MVRQYETIIIVTPLLTESEVKDVIGKFKQLMLDNNAEIINEEDWGLRKLAYPIKKKTTAFYYLFEYKVEATFIKKLDVEFKRDDRIMRQLTVSMDKDAIAYSIRRRKNRSKETTDDETQARS